MIVEIYKNLHKSRAAKQNIYSVRDKKSGLVINHVKNISLKNVTFHVNESGRQRVLATKRKNVHCWVSGEPIKNPVVNLDNYQQIWYNPYKTDQFTNLKTGEKVYNCKFAQINEDGVFIK